MTFAFDEAKPRRRALRIAVRLVGPLLLVFLLQRTGSAVAFATLRQSEPGALALSAVLLVFGVALKAQRWRLLLAAEALEVGWLRATMAYFAAIALGALTPGRVGELYRAWPVAKEADVPVARVLPGVLFDRFFDQCALGLASLLALLVLPSAFSGPGLAVLASGAVFLAFTIFVFHERTAGLLERLPGLRKLAIVSVGFRKVPRSTIAACGGLTLLSYVAFFAQCVILARTVKLQSSALSLIAATALGNIAAFLPVTLFGMGTREATIGLVLGSVGVVTGQAVGYSLLLGAMSYGTALICGGLSLLVGNNVAGRFAARPQTDLR